MSERNARRYTAEERAQILEHYRVHGKAATLRAFPPLSWSTLNRWRKADGVETEVASNTQAATEARQAQWDARRQELKEKLLLRADEMLDRMGEKHTLYVGTGATPTAVEIERPPANVCKDLAVTAAVLIDKLRLENGESTGKQSLDVTVTDEDRRRAEAEVAAAMAEAASQAIAEAEQIARDAVD